MKEIFAEIVRWLYFKILTLCNPLKNKILFMSFQGKQYSDNPRAVCEKMHELFPEYELVWYLNADVSKFEIIPDYVRVVHGRWFRFLRELATARCFVTNTQLGRGIFKRKGQFFVQTWHADISPKRVLLSDTVQRHRGFVLKDDRYTDVCVAGSDLGEQMYRKSFGYHGEILKCGMPRNDVIVNNSVDKDKILKKICGYVPNQKILLYAPTFRDHLLDEPQQSLDLGAVLDCLDGEENQWICLIRAHINVKNIQYDETDKRIMNVSEYPDMADILAVSDLLISDYSSCQGDFILSGKPAVNFLWDLDEYQQKCRGLLFDMEEAGFLVAYDKESLYSLLRNLNAEEIAKSNKRVIRNFNIHTSGNASEQVCGWIHRRLSLFDTMDHSRLGGGGKRWFWFIYKIEQKVRGRINRIRTKIYTDIFSECGSNLTVNGKIYIWNPHLIHCGDNVTLNGGVQLAPRGHIYLGNHVTMSRGSQITAGELDTTKWDLEGTKDKEHIAEDVVIAPGTWLCVNSVILPGVKITGRGVIVAAGAVVTKSFSEDLVILGGVPAKVIVDMKLLSEE